MLHLTYTCNVQTKISFYPPVTVKWNLVVSTFPFLNLFVKTIECVITEYSHFITLKLMNDYTHHHFRFLLEAYKKSSSETTYHYESITKNYSLLIQSCIGFFQLLKSNYGLFSVDSPYFCSSVWSEQCLEIILSIVYSFFLLTCYGTCRCVAPFFLFRKTVSSSSSVPISDIFAKFRFKFQAKNTFYSCNLQFL